MPWRCCKSFDIDLSRPTDQCLFIQNWELIPAIPCRCFNPILMIHTSGIKLPACGAGMGWVCSRYYWAHF